MNVDWPLATGLAIIFVVVSAIRWRRFRARMARRAGPPSGHPPAAP